MANRDRRPRGRRTESGATAVEFAFVAPLLLFLFAGIVEFSIYFLKVGHLKHKLYEASRVLQTGEIQGMDDPLASFGELKCSGDQVLIPCENVFFDVRNFSTLGSIDLPDAQFDEDGRPTNFVFQPGGSDDITVMRIASPHRFIMPYMGDIFGVGDAPAILIGYSVAKNEPF